MQKQRKTSNTTTSEIVLESLREQIINGTLQPQEKLIEAEIAQKFGLSRGPVREALRQLAVEGLVDYCPNKGCTVALLSPQDAYEVFFLRGSLEKLAIQKSNCLLSDYSLRSVTNAIFPETDSHIVIIPCYYSIPDSCSHSFNAHSRSKR